MISRPASCPVFFGDFRTSFIRLAGPRSVARVFSLMGPRGAGRPKLNHFAWLMSLALTAIDGVRFNLRNTSAINANTREARSGKDGTPCAYAQMLCSVLVEFGTHCPLAVSLKTNVHGANSLRQAQTVESAAMEVMALLPTAAVLAWQRLGVAGEAGVPALKISLAQVREQSLALSCVLVPVWICVAGLIPFRHGLNPFCRYRLDQI